MVILVIKNVNIAVAEREGVPPVAVHQDRPTASLLANAWMQAEARYVHIFNGDSRFQRGCSALRNARHVLLATSWMSALQELSETVSRADNAVDLDAVVVAVVKHFAIEGLGQRGDR